MPCYKGRSSEDYSVLDAAIGKLGDYDWVVFYIGKWRGLFFPGA